MEFRGGHGGYGGITSMNQDQRTGRYAPHGAISKITDYLTDTVRITCLSCGESWEHPRSAPNAPPECAKRVRNITESVTSAQTRNPFPVPQPEKFARRAGPRKGGRR